MISPENDEEIKFKDKFVFDNVEFNVKKCEGEDLINFYKDHGEHYKMCVEKNKKGKKKDKKNKNKNKKAKK